MNSPKSLMMTMMMMMNHKWRMIAIPKLENHSTSHPSKQRRLDFSASWINFCPTCCRTHAAMRPIMVIKEKTIATYGWSTYPPPGHLPDSSLMPAAKSLFLKGGEVDQPWEIWQDGCWLIEKSLSFQKGWWFLVISMHSPLGSPDPQMSF